MSYNLRKYILEKTQIHKVNVKTHAIGWIVYWVTDIGFTLAVDPNSIGSITTTLKNVIFFITLFYFILFFALLPYLPNQKFKATGNVIILVAFFIITKYFINIYILKIPQTTLFVNGKFGYVSYEIYRFTQSGFFAFAYWVYLQSLQIQQQYFDSELKLKDTEAVLLNTEIKFLKAQVNPHFLFNTLNFFYSETYKLSPKLGEGISSLTEILRYTVQSTQNEEIIISKEAEFLHKYIGIQQLRFHNKLEVKVNINILKQNLKIPPLILLTFVENAFKYGVTNENQNPLEITLLSENNQIKFYCKNKKSKHFKDPSTSVGLENIKTRLEKHHINYDLNIKDENEFYIVDFKMEYNK